MVDKRARARGLRLVAVLIALASAVMLTPGAAWAERVTAHVFWQEGCPHCAHARDALQALAATNGALALDEIQLGVSDADDALFADVVDHFAIERPGVPLVVIGAAHVTGFSAGSLTTDRYGALIARCLEVPCTDPVAALRGSAIPPVPVAADPTGTPPPLGMVTLPLIGEVSLGGLSLPALTVVLAAIDGFNPCAMWVLALLIGLLLGAADTRRMWILGGVFLLATGAMYFAVMAAWLNLVLWIGAVGWLRIAIGILALGAGGYYLREYWTNPEGMCRVTPAGRRKSIADAFRAMVEKPSLPLAALGVAALAVAVNLVELVCSAGIPAIYTQVLAMQDFSAPVYYVYIALYLAIFLLDDAAIFAVAMITLRSVAATGRYARLSHLIGGIVLLALGAVMVLRPDLLG